MPSTLELLSLTPEEGLSAIVQSSLKAGFSAKHFKYGNPIVLNDTLTEIPISINKSNVPVEYWRFNGEVNFRYHRFNLETVFGDLPAELRLDFPVTCAAIVEELGKRYQIGFSPSDYLPGMLAFGEGDTILLQAAEHSFRWIGSVPIVVKPKVRPIDTVLIHTALLGLDYSPFLSDPVQQLLTNVYALNMDTMYRVLQSDEVAFSTPIKLNNEDVENNTSVILTMVNCPLYTDSVRVTYRRLYLPRLTNYLPVDITSGSALTTGDLAMEAAGMFNIPLQRSDIIDEALPYLRTGETATVTVYSKPESLGFCGELTIDWTKG